MQVAPQAGEVELRPVWRGGTPGQRMRPEVKSKKEIDTGQADKESREKSKKQEEEKAGGRRRSTVARTAKAPPISEKTPTYEIQTLNHLGKHLYHQS